LLEDVGRVARGGTGERFPLRAVRLQIVGDTVAVTARSSKEIPGKLTGTSESESHRIALERRTGVRLTGIRTRTGARP
jgi:hypothetical protein